MSRIKRFGAFLLLTVILWIGYMAISSSPLDSLEKQIITKSDIKVITIGQYEFGKGGLVLVGTDKNDVGVLKTYAKIPIFARFVETRELDFKKQNTPVDLIGESWVGYQVLRYQDGTLKQVSDGRGMGFGRRVLRWFFLSSSVSCLITYGPEILRNIRKRKERA